MKQRFCWIMKNRMENSQGDLADVVRAAAAASSASGLLDWPFAPGSDAATYTHDLADRDFGDPFAFTGDPLLQNADPDPAGFFCNSDAIRDDCGGSTSSWRKEVDGHDQIVKTPSDNIFSTLLQISPNDVKLSPVEPPPPAVGPPRVLKAPSPAILSSNNNNNNRSRTLISMGASDMQISSPQNTGNKRRKCQARKVVCIPAPAPANSRASGEIVPSDLWAWRKYGQKPIKDSPYPRGYYRCSSSKGCSARKQVERSRADPNMLVITYTSDHNHPWPTHRNTLAGSTRSQPSKTTATTKAGPAHSGQQNETDRPPHSKPNVKQEMAGPRLELSNDFFEEDGGFVGPAIGLSEDSFFADLEEIESEPLDELFARGFHGGSKDFEPFALYDWVAEERNITTAATTAGDNDNNVGNS